MKHFLLPTIFASTFMLVSAMGCHHEAPQPQMPPMQAQAPPVTDPATHPVPMEIIPLEPKPDTSKTVASVPADTTPPPVAKPEKRRKPSAAKPQPPATATPTTAKAQPLATTPQAVTTPPAVVAPVQTQPPAAQVPTPTASAAPHPSSAASPIGQLTEGDISGTAQVQEETEKLIASTERGLTGLQRPLNAQEQETAKQIKKFLEQARQALLAQDAGGAKTLATKASLLLNELKK